MPQRTRHARSTHHAALVVVSSQSGSPHRGSESEPDATSTHPEYVASCFVVMWRSPFPRSSLTQECVMTNSLVRSVERSIIFRPQAKHQQGHRLLLQLVCHSHILLSGLHRPVQRHRTDRPSRHGCRCGSSILRLATPRQSLPGLLLALSWAWVAAVLGHVSSLLVMWTVVTSVALGGVLMALDVVGYQLT